MSELACFVGTVHWCGTYDGCPAIVTTRYGCANLWVFHEGAWWQASKGDTVRAVTPRKCTECGRELPFRDSWIPVDDRYMAGKGGGG